MRFDELLLRVPGEDDGLRIRFHENLTVLAGVGSLERQALTDAVLGALTGVGEATTLACIDHTGRAMEITTLAGRVSARYLDDGSAAPVPIGWFAADAEALRALVVLGPDAFGPDLSSAPRDDDQPELAEARAVLRSLTDELATAEECRRRVELADVELAALHERIAVAEGEVAKREYARVLAELERVRSEAAVLQSGGSGAEVDHRLLDAADEARRLAASWNALTATTEQVRLAVDADDAVEAVDVARLAEVPTEAPFDLAAIVAELVRAGSHVAALEDRLRVVASASLPEPADPRVLSLATIDQDELWAAHGRVAEAAAALQREQVAVGGLGVDGERAAAILELELAHAGAEAASNLIEERRVPVIAGSALAATSAFVLGGSSPLLSLLLCAAAAAVAAVGIGLPWRARTEAERREEVALERVGVPTYLGFHLRRVDATIDPRTLDRLALAQAELEAASRSWTSASKGVEVTIGEAAVIESAVREYAAALQSQHGAVQEVAELRRTLDELALPDLQAARAHLELAVEPYGLGAADLDGLEPELVAGFVAGQVALGFAARARRALDAAVADEEKIAGRLDDALARLGFGDGTMADRIAALEWAVDRAREREVARAAARSREAVEADLTRLNAEVRRLRRPEWTDVTALEAHGPSVDELVAERDHLAAALEGVRKAVSAEEIDRLVDRHSAAERRVAAVEAQLRGSMPDPGADVSAAQQHLLAALTRSNCVGPRGEPLPVVLDDPFVRVAAECKWELMDMIHRLAEKVQILYLTDDPFVGAWARRRADAGAITLLEPVE